ncbi:probable DNA-directed RNA polymerase III subunit RPC6 [Saccharomycodes ludwigii]|uniref:DNA-directed RNA polymerase III subunit RPC6 n=1 Tax=Saccharomycodes ludwigii TaxID=36035 RepID=A0A376B0M4_9ASCO|nr:hypothetical protein SCDLUD_003446 [Saccharomycodes ludwigii]KAH3900463.1 hypothetical protein SCDLUD_003446 [Saccharomycodes ludwigii]SSD58245.1 probable DNA-directed RNA polymerase III subunit RPC6 [Saccharomycodes ludwigii]
MNSNTNNNAATIEQQQLLQLSDRAKDLHDKMLLTANKVYTQQEIQDLMGLNNLQDLMLIVQELLNNNLVKLMKQNNQLKFQAVSINEAFKKSKMSADESLVYSYIESSGREGIWIKTIKARTNLHQHVVMKCLKNLEAAKYVKSIKNVKYPTRKIYMLYNLQPSIEVTGGPWFTDGELDVEFINSLLTIIWRFIAEKTYPNGFNNFEQSERDESNNENNGKLFSYNVKNYASAQEILNFINSSNISKVDLSTHDIISLCESLRYDDKLEKIGFDSYKVTLNSIVQMNSGSDLLQTVQTKNSNNRRRNETFNIFKFTSYISPSRSDKEGVYFDEWIL